MTDPTENAAAEDAALKSAGRRLDAALARLERGMAGLSARVPAPAEPDRARETALEAALQNASETMGGLIAEVRAAIAAAEEAAMDAQPQPEGDDGQR